MSLWGLPRTISDHIPIVLGMELNDWGPRSFKMINSWLNQKNCVEVIKDTLQLEFTHNEDLSTKPRRVKGALQKWNKESYWNVDNEVKEMEKRINELDKKDILHVWMITRGMRAVKLRSKKRLILGVNLGKANETGPLKLRAKVFNFFSNHFQRRRKQWNTVLNLPFKRVLVADVEEMEASITIEEIKDAVWSCDESKAPGPDSFNILFFKKLWEWLKSDLLKAVERFLKFGKLGKNVNTSFLALIRKVDSPSEIEEYRLISLESEARGGLILKLDFVKAYDCVCWEFLDSIQQ
ncbi:uncharacterized protein LOC120146361 [Hibiscus syriacus]|uniref:uncharacterized protein LOC120146361 n=1 Tax=Hibiscus syriacus TaxID=106335 RepID=UPI001920E1AB|nr:uncharacterized protein LOC120146361 [Hibiscus syriacus]